MVSTKTHVVTDGWIRCDVDREASAEKQRTEHGRLLLGQLQHQHVVAVPICDTHRPSAPVGRDGDQPACVTQIELVARPMSGSRCSRTAISTTCSMSVDADPVHVGRPTIVARHPSVTSPPRPPEPAASRGDLLGWTWRLRRRLDVSRRSRRTPRPLCPSSGRRVSTCSHSLSTRPSPRSRRPVECLAPAPRR